MPKKFFFLIFIFLFQTIFILFSFANPVLAVSCKESEISFSPKSLPDDPNGTTINFQINNQQVLKYLQGGEIKLEAEGPYNPQNPIKTGRPISYSGPEIINQSSFSLTITNYSTGGIGSKKGEYFGKLTFKSPGSANFNNFCDNINYTIGSGDLLNLTCSIDSTVPSTLPLDSPLIVRFKADTNAGYDLRVTKNPFALGGLIGVVSPNIAASTATDGYGLGEFSPVQITGNQGDTIRLTVHPSSVLLYDLALCTKDITLNVAASPQPSLPPRAKNLKLGAFGGETAKSAGIPCPGGLETAIGCIPTDPTEFVKGFLKFSVAIAGGVALLIMVLGSFKMIISAGNPDSLKEGQEMFTNAIIGLLFIIFSTLLLKIIGVDILGLGKFLGF